MRTYRIADLNVNMDVQGRTQSQADIYMVPTTDKPDATLPPYGKNKVRALDPLGVDDAEYMFSGYCFYSTLIGFDGLMLHASAVVMDGKAYLFSAPSGTGKSTHTELWQSVFGADKAQIINDDKPAIRCVDGRWYAYGTPWSGKSTTSLNVRVPIAGICFLSRGEENSIKKMPPVQAVFSILNQTVRTQHAVLRQMLLATLDRLVSQVNVYEMQCNMEPEAALLSHRVMSGDYETE